MKSLTKLSLALAAGAALPAILSGAPLVSLGDNLDLFINSKAGVRYESNPTLASENADDEGDAIFLFSPGVELVAGRPGLTNFSGRILYRHDFMVYADHSDLDTDNANLTANGTYSTEKLKVNSGVRFREMQTNYDLGNLAFDVPAVGFVKRELLSFTNYADYEISNKTSIGVGLNVSTTVYKDVSGYKDYETYSVPVDFYYALTPKTDLSVGYRYRLLQADPDFDDHFFNVGIHNEIAPKTRGSILVGYQYRDPEQKDRDDDSALTIEANVDYLVSPLTTLSVTVSRDYNFSGAANASLLQTGGHVTATHSLSPVLAASGTLGLYRYEYLDNAPGKREDDYFNASAGLVYTPNENLQIMATYVYYNNDSVVRTSDFRNNVVEVSALFRY